MEQIESTAGLATEGSCDFFIKAGYRTNPPQTFDAGCVREYWQGERLRLNGSYQYFVYLLSQKLQLHHRFETFMDVGCGPAVKVRELIAPHFDSITFVDQPNIRELAMAAVPTATFVAANLEDIDITLSKQFDLIVCADVVEHLADPSQCFEFIRTHLSDHGFAVVSTPERDILRGCNAMKSGNPVHVREWNGAEFRKLLRHYGFSLSEYRCVPQMKIPYAEFVLTQTLRVHRLAIRWGGCQIAVLQSK